MVAAVLNHHLIYSSFEHTEFRSRPRFTKKTKDKLSKNVEKSQTKENLKERMQLTKSLRKSYDKHTKNLGKHIK